MKKLIQEAHRRSLWQVLGIYLAGSWIVLQVIEVLANNMGLPDWVFPFAIILLLIGLPIVLATAFVQEGMSSGGAATGAASDGAPEPAPTVAGTAGAASSDTSPSSTSPAQPASSGGRHLFTWRNALVGGGLAFAVLAVLTVGYLTMRTMGIGPAGTLVAKGVLEERSTILLAEFGSEDESLARAATEAFRIDLSQSEVVKLAEPSFVSDALERMQRAPDENIDLALAREIAQREGLPAVIAGEINPAGDGYVLTAELVAAESGEVLASHRESAASSGEVVGAIDELSKRLRERIGDSFRTIRSDPPLERVSTSDLEALRLYSEAVQVFGEGNDERAMGLLEETVARDSTFAMAWRKLGVIIRNRREDPARGIEALTRAYELRDRLTKRERYWATASYFQQGTGEPEKAIPAYESLLQLDPDDARALNNMGVAYGQMGNPEKSEEYYLRSIAADSTNSTALGNVVITQVELGKLDEAKASLAVYDRLIPGNPQVHVRAAELAYLQGESDEAMQELETLRDEMTASLFWRAQTSYLLSDLVGVHGKLAEVEIHVADAEQAQRERELPAEALDAALLLAWYDLGVRKDPARALATLEEILGRYDLGAMDPIDRDYPELASLYALAGRPDRAREMLAVWEAEVPEDLRGDAFAARGVIAQAEGDYAEALRLLRSWEEDTTCEFCPLPALGWTYDLSGQPDSTIANFERYTQATSLGRLGFDANELAGIYERLGQLYDQKGDLENAAKYYAAFVELWSEADEELQPRVRVAQARLEEIVRERG